MYAVRPADFKRRACSAVSIPSVVHTSMPSAATSSTILMTASNAGPSCTSLHAAPIQKRVDPFSRAVRAAVKTACGSINASRATQSHTERSEDSSQSQGSRRLISAAATWNGGRIVM